MGCGWCCSSMSRVGPSTKSIFWIGRAFPPRTAAAATRVKRVSGNVAFWHKADVLMDIELAVDAIELAEYIDQMVLFSGDGDFRSLVEAVQRRGVRVTVISTISSQPPMIADELRRQADGFIDLVELRSEVGRERAAPARATLSRAAIPPARDRDGASG